MYNYEWLEKRDKEAYRALEEKLDKFFVDYNDKNFNSIFENHLKCDYPELFEEYQQQTFDVIEVRKDEDSDNFGLTDSGDDDDWLDRNMDKVIICIVIFVIAIIGVLTIANNI